MPIIAGGVRLSAVLREAGRNGYGGKLEGYHALYYANAKDGRLFVPKITGVGLTINFAHAWACRR